MLVIELAAFLVVAALSYISVRFIKQWTRQHQIIDIPNQRSSHSVPTPRGGGLAIVVLTVCGWLLFGLLSHTDSPVILLAYALGASIIAAISWLDDLHSLTPYRRFAAQFAATILVILAIGYWQQVDIPLIGMVSLAWFGAIITLFWIVGLTNAYNFMDGIDGIAAGQALVCGLGWVILAGNSPALESAKVLGLLIAASSFGFLIHNWAPASIFMGDVGSAFLGFSFALIPLLTVHGHFDYLIVGALMYWAFIFDTLLTFLRRLIRHENVLAPHRTHLYQRLVIAGYSVPVVTLIYTVSAGLGVLAARLWLIGDDHLNAVIIVVILSLCLGLWLFVNRAETQHAQLSTKSLTSAERH